jgi:hypothetical protein
MIKSKREAGPWFECFLLKHSFFLGGIDEGE